MQARQRHTPLRALRRTLIASLVAACLGSAQAAEPVNIDIAAQPLAAAMARLAEQSGIKLLYAADLLAGKTAPRIEGRLTPQQVLDKLLVGSGLRYQFIAPDAAKIEAAPAEKSTQLSPIEIRGAAETDSVYYRRVASTATKTDTPLMQMPMTVAVIPHQILEDQGITSSGLADALAYLGVQTLGMKDQGDYLTFRGFTSPTTLWNGFRIEDATPSISYANGGVWMENVERLEVLKGPASILYGRTEPGGAVNVLTKKPQADFRGEVNAGVGSWNNRRLGADLTGALNTDKSLRYRLNLALEDSESWYRHVPKSHSEGIAPALEWRISPQTTMSFEGQYRRFEGGSNAQQYIPIDPATGQPISVDAKDTMLPGNLSRFKQNRTLVAFNHQLNADWAVSWKIMHNDADNPYYRNNLAAGGSVFPLGPGATAVWVFEGRNRQKTDATMLDVTGHVTALGIRHTLLLGMDYYRKEFNQLSGADWAQTTDFLNPALPTPVALTDTWHLNNREYAWYVQDQMELPGNWHLLLGGRQQSIDEHNVSDMPSMFAGPQDVIYKKRVFLPRFGLLWQPRPWLSTYYSYAENMGSSNGLDFTGTPIKPEWSKQHELGIKSEWLDGRLNATLALFDLTKFNIASADPANPGFNIGVGEVRSAGYELNIQGALTHAWNILANYSHARPRVVTGATGAAALQPQTIVAGQDLPYVSNETFSLWTSYKLPGEALAGWRVGGGANWSAAPNPFSGSTVKTNSYTVTSAFASYETKVAGHKTILQLNINNLFDKKYLVYQGDSDDGLGNRTLAGSWGTPRQVRLSLRSEF